MYTTYNKHQMIPILSYTEIKYSARLGQTQLKLRLIGLRGSIVKPVNCDAYIASHRHRSMLIPKIQLPTLEEKHSKIKTKYDRHFIFPNLLITSTSMPGSPRRSRANPTVTSINNGKRPQPIQKELIHGTSKYWIWYIGYPWKRSGHLAALAILPKVDAPIGRRDEGPWRRTRL
jgi:hypothetical protein